MAEDHVLSETELQEALGRLPGWEVRDNWLRRTYHTPGWTHTMMLANVIGYVAEAAWHHPDITASYAWVEVRLMNHAAKGITDKDFALAKRFEEVIQWQPGKEGGAFEGTPPDPRFAYVKYDD